jgi:hypothetical protein
MDDFSALDYSNDYAFLLPDDDVFALFSDFDIELGQVQLPSSEVQNLSNMSSQDLMEPVSTSMPTSSEFLNSSVVLVDSAPSFSEADISLIIQPRDTNQGPAFHGLAPLNDYSSSRPQIRRNHEDHPDPSTKRKLEESIVVFPVDPSAKVVPKRRKGFSSSRKAEVALNRLVGSCVQCRVRKGPVSYRNSLNPNKKITKELTAKCNFEIPCDYCVKRSAGCIKMAQEICTRQSLTATRFDNLGKFVWDSYLLAQASKGANRWQEIFGIVYYERRIEQLGIKALDGLRRFVYIGYPPLEGHDPAESFIRVPVIDYWSPLEPLARSFVNCNYYSSLHVHVQTRASAIAWDSLPSIDALIKCYKISQDNFSFRSGPFSGLQHAIKVFIEHYCSMTANLPLVRSLIFHAILLQ